MRNLCCRDEINANKKDEASAKKASPAMRFVDDN
jgi:hypothetical protein